MRSSLFRAKLPRAMLLEFLDDVGHKEACGVIVNDELLKRNGRTARIAAFLSAAATYYYPSKRHYVRQVNNAKTLMTVVRQICRTHCIGVRSRAVYLHGGYAIHYIIVAGTCREVAM